MNRLKLIISMVCIIVGSLATMAHDFTVTINGQKIYFNITSKTRQTAEVTYRGSITDTHTPDAKGILEIPAKVKHGKIVYNITKIGPKAFCGFTELTGVILPHSIKEIGDFAFEGCTKLSKVVFPGGDVKMGQGTFFKCTALKDLSFGSDWKVLNLSPYRWSDSLRTVNVPAKVEKIMNLKSIISLCEIKADANNPKFSTYQGVLYNKDSSVLYGVPRAYKGTLKVKDGTISITNGALIDCLYITLIDLPASIQTMSFRETSRMTELKKIIFRNEQPIITAYNQGKACFLLQVANPTVEIYVTKSAKKEYARQMVVTPGEYVESTQSDGIPYRVEAAFLPKTKNIKGLKKFQ